MMFLRAEFCIYNILIRVVCIIPIKYNCCKNRVFLFKFEIFVCSYYYWIVFNIIAPFRHLVPLYGKSREYAVLL